MLIPRHAADVVNALAVCRDHDLPVIARGCGTGLSGQSLNAAVMFDFSRYMRGDGGSGREPDGNEWHSGPFRVPVKSGRISKGRSSWADPTVTGV